MTNPFRTDLIDIFIRRGHKGKEIAEEVREIEALLAPVLADAEKWKKVSSLVEGDCNSCKALRYCEKNGIHPCEILKDALEGEGEQG